MLWWRSQVEVFFTLERKRRSAVATCMVSSMALCKCGSPFSDVVQTLLTQRIASGSCSTGGSFIGSVMILHFCGATLVHNVPALLLHSHMGLSRICTTTAVGISRREIMHTLVLTQTQCISSGWNPHAQLWCVCKRSPRHRRKHAAKLCLTSERKVCADFCAPTCSRYSYTYRANLEKRTKTKCQSDVRWPKQFKTSRKTNH